VGKIWRSKDFWFLTGDSLHVVGAVELSSDPNFKALYLGDDPKEIARMTPAEQAAAAIESEPRLCRSWGLLVGDAWPSRIKALL